MQNCMLAMPISTAFCLFFDLDVRTTTLQARHFDGTVL